MKCAASLVLCLALLSSGEVSAREQLHYDDVIVAEVEPGSTGRRLEPEVVMDPAPVALQTWRRWRNSEWSRTSVSRLLEDKGRFEQAKIAYRLYYEAKTRVAAIVAALPNGDDRKTAFEKMSLGETSAAVPLYFDRCAGYGSGNFWRANAQLRKPLFPLLQLRMAPRRSIPIEEKKALRLGLGLAVDGLLIGLEQDWGKPSFDDFGNALDKVETRGRTLLKVLDENLLFVATTHGLSQEDTAAILAEVDAKVATVE